MRNYRTKDGQADFGFSYEKQGDGNYRIYIESMPSYRGRDTSLSTTHRLPDGDRRYVCWTGPMPTQADADKVAALWSDLTQEHIKTGRTIDQQIADRRGK